MSSLDVGSIASGAQAGAAFGPIGMGVGAVVGGVFGSRSKKKKKKAERMLREVNAIKRMQNRKMAIVDAISQQAMAAATGYGEGYNPEGTSTAVGIQQSIYSQAQSNLKTESMVYNRQEQAAKYIKQAGRLDNTFAAIKGIAGAAGTLKDMLPPRDPKPIDTSTLPKRRRYESGSYVSQFSSPLS